jgi:hypothetical protein
MDNVKSVGKESMALGKSYLFLLTYKHKRVGDIGRMQGKLMYN